MLVGIKGLPVASVSGPGPAEQAYGAAIAAHRPTLAFFHSRSCDSCIEMMRVVGEVYPEFEGTLALVDVDVYDARNTALLHRARIAAIPTLLLVDASGQEQRYLGVMDAAHLRERLSALAGGG